jgi:hypothetical protein
MNISTFQIFVTLSLLRFYFILVLVVAMIQAKALPMKSYVNALDCVHFHNTINKYVANLTFV